MRPITLIIGIAITCILMNGCCSVRVCNQGDRKMCYVENSGWKLFGFIPLASGDPSLPNLDSPLFFTNTVTLKTNMLLLEQAMRCEHATRVINLSSYHTDEQVLIFLCKRYTYHTSAELR